MHNWNTTNARFLPMTDLYNTKHDKLYILCSKRPSRSQVRDRIVPLWVNGESTSFNHFASVLAQINRQRGQRFITALEKFSSCPRTLNAARFQLPMSVHLSVGWSACARGVANLPSSANTRSEFRNSTWRGR